MTVVEKSFIKNYTAEECIMWFAIAMDYKTRYFVELHNGLLIKMIIFTICCEKKKNFERFYIHSNKTLKS